LAVVLSGACSLITFSKLISALYLILLVTYLFQHNQLGRKVEEWYIHPYIIKANYDGNFTHQNNNQGLLAGFCLLTMYGAAV